MGAILFDAEDTSSSATKHFRNEKRRLILFYIPLSLIASFVLEAVIQPGKGGGRLFDVLTGLVLNFLTFVWIKFDSEERRYRLHRLFPFTVVIFGIFALLYYLFRSRGIREGFLSTAWLVLYVAACFLTVTIVAVLVLAGLISAGFVTANVFDQ